MKMIMHHTHISIPEKNRIELVSLLNKSLASTTDLYMQLKQAHWNIKGLSFIAVHTLLDELAEQIEAQIDIIAERITALGGTALGTVQEIEQNTELRIYPTHIFSISEHLEHLIYNSAILSEFSRKNVAATQEIGDMVTNDIYIALVRLLEHQLWLLQAHLQK